MSDNVIGPIEHSDWYLLRMLRESIRHMKSVDPIKYKLAIDVHSKTYKNTIREYIEK